MRVWRSQPQPETIIAQLLSSHSAQCNYVGVGGSIPTGGISWLCSEYGLASGPQNMLDAQIVKTNRQVVWASAEPDLLWALRGGGAGLGSRPDAMCRVDELIEDL
jgi:hypothetical protein